MNKEKESSQHGFVRLATPDDLDNYQRRIKQEMRNEIPKSMLPRTTEKADSITPYVIAETENGESIGTLDVYDPFVLLLKEGRDFDAFVIDLNSLDTLGLNVSYSEWQKRDYRRTWSGQMPKEEFKSLFLSQPWLQHPYIANLSILPSYRQRGFGTKLVTEAIEQHRAVNRDLYPTETELLYWGKTTNPNMLRLVEKLGGHLIDSSMCYHKHLSLLGCNEPKQSDLLDLKRKEVKQVCLGESGAFGTDLVYMDDHLVAVSMQETIDASPKGPYTSPHQELLLINPSIDKPDALVGLIMAGRRATEMELWINVFQVPEQAWGQRQEISGEVLRKVKKNNALFVI